MPVFGWYYVGLYCWGILNEKLKPGTSWGFQHSLYYACNSMRNWRQNNSGAVGISKCWYRQNNGKCAWSGSEAGSVSDSGQCRVSIPRIEPGPGTDRQGYNHCRSIPWDPLTIAERGTEIRAGNPRLDECVSRGGNNLTRHSGILVTTLVHARSSEQRCSPLHLVQFLTGIRQYAPTSPRYLPNGANTPLWQACTWIMCSINNRNWARTGILVVKVSKISKVIWIYLPINLDWSTNLTGLRRASARSLAMRKWLEDGLSGTFLAEIGKANQETGQDPLRWLDGVDWAVHPAHRRNTSAQKLWTNSVHAAGLFMRKWWSDWMLISTAAEISNQMNLTYSQRWGGDPPIPPCSPVTKPIPRQNDQILWRKTSARLTPASWLSKRNCSGHWLRHISVWR